MRGFIKLKTVKWVGIAVAVGVVGGYVYVGEVWVPKQIEYTAQEISIQTIDKSDEMFAAKIDVLKNEVVADLEKCESGGYGPDAGIVIFDTNNKASVGPLQMQKDHVKHFYKKLYSTEVTGQEAVIIAVTPEKARALAKDVLFKVNDGWTEWYNCGKKLALENRVKTIKALEQ